MARPRGRGLERERERKAEERAAADTTASRRKLFLLAGTGILVAAGVVAYLMTRPPPPDIAVQTFADQGAQHVPEGTQVDYNSNPPTSGPHSPAWARCGIYTQEVPDLNQVHTLEHGAVIMQYDPALAEEEVSRLHGIARNLRNHVLVAPRSDLPSPVVLTAWTRLVELDGADEPAIREFYRRFAGQGPERAVCPFEVDEAA